MKKKGFTLIELLAVIVILAVIALIAVPQVLKILNNARRGAAENSVTGIKDSAELYMSNFMLKNNAEIPSKLIFNCDGEKCELTNTSKAKLTDYTYEDKLDIKGKIPTSGNVVITKKGVEVKHLKFGEFLCEYDNKSECSKSEVPDVIEVTLDADGGTLTNNKVEVKYGSTYGNLPTPTKEGYTFLGWNGKNMFYLVGRTEQNPGPWSNTTIRSLSGNGIYVGLTANNYYSNAPVSNFSIDTLENTVGVYTTTGGYGIGFDLPIEANKTYTVSVKNKVQFRMAFYKENGEFISYLSRNGSSYTFTTPEDTYWYTFIACDEINKLVYYTNIQLEEGDIASEFEPYLIDNDTIVIQDSNHTLKAIWKQN